MSGVNAKDIFERRLRALEAQMLQQIGISPNWGEDAPEQISSLVAATRWNEALHPRGRDGRFIEKFGFIRGLFNWMKDAGGLSNPKAPGEKKEVGRAKIVGFSTDNGGTIENPWVKVEYDGPDKDLKGLVGYARAGDVVSVAGAKAQLNKDEVMTPDVPGARNSRSEAPQMPAVPIGAEELKKVLSPDDITAIYADGGEPKVVSSIDEALSELALGNKVNLPKTTDVSVLLDRMVEIVNDAKSKGSDAPTYNLCSVLVELVSLFCASHKGIPRIKMPQLTGKPLPGSPADSMDRNASDSVDLAPAFREYLAEKGVSITDTSIRADHLKASQNELNGPKVGGIAQAIEDGKFDPNEDRIFVSSDNYVVDGHHRWAALAAVGYETGGARDLDVAQVDMSILELLAEANAFAKRMGIPQQDATTKVSEVDVPSAKPKPAKVLDRTSASYGLTYDGWFEGHPIVQRAREFEDWEALPTEEVDPKDLIAIEKMLASSSIDKVVSGKVPLRTGYTVQVVRLDDGRMIIADGHHRAAMASAMGRPLEVKILDASDLDMSTMPDRVRPNDPHLWLPDVYQNHDLADRVEAQMAAVEAIEPQVTETLVGLAEQFQGEMGGLPFRFKQPKGVLEKIIRKAAKKFELPETELTDEHLASVTINDALRYTMLLPSDRYTDGVRAAIQELRDLGFDMPDTDIKNSWYQHDGYNGINATFTDPKTGQQVELQFHTPESFEMKETGTHADYEIVRVMSNVELERIAAYERMVALADSIPMPAEEGLVDIGVGTRRPFTPAPIPVQGPALAQPLLPEQGVSTGAPANATSSPVAASGAIKQLELRLRVHPKLGAGKNSNG